MEYIGIEVVLITDKGLEMNDFTNEIIVIDNIQDIRRVATLRNLELSSSCKGYINEDIHDIKISDLDLFIRAWYVSQNK